MQAAKLVIVAGEDEYLLLHRNDHPIFGNDPDIPGGTLEDGESVQETMIREVQEEIGVTMSPDQVRQLYAGRDYSKDGTNYVLFIAKLSDKPIITLSDEHDSYNWVKRENFLASAKSAQDNYMHMVASEMARLHNL